MHFMLFLNFNLFLLIFSLEHALVNKNGMRILSLSMRIQGLTIQHKHSLNQLSLNPNSTGVSFMDPQGWPHGHFPPFFQHINDYELLLREKIRKRNNYRASNQIVVDKVVRSCYRSLSGSPLLSLLEARTSSAAITVIIMVGRVSVWHAGHMKRFSPFTQYLIWPNIYAYVYYQNVLCAIGQVAKSPNEREGFM